MLRTSVRAGVLCCVIALGGACTDADAKQGADRATPTAPKVPAATIQPSGPVLRIGEHQVSVVEYARLLGPAPARRNREPESIRRRTFLQELERTELLAIEAQRRGITARPEVQQSARMRSIEKMMQDLFGEHGSEVAPVTDDDVRDYYDTHLEDFSTKETVRARHLLVQTEREAKSLLARLRKTPMDFRMFAELAVKHSIDSATQSRGGDLGVFTLQPPSPMLADAMASASMRPREIPEAVRAAAFALAKPGDVSEPLRTSLGVHLVQLGARYPATRYKLEQVQRVIAQSLREERQTAALEAFTKRVMTAANVQLDKEKLGLVRVQSP